MIRCNSLLNLYATLNCVSRIILLFLDMIRNPMPPNYLTNMPLPSTRGNHVPFRQRPVPSRGGQLQIAGVVVGSWGANYGYQNNGKQHQQQSPSLLGNYQGRGRGVGGYHYVPQFSRGRGYNNQHQQQRKVGPPTFNVNRKNNVSVVYLQNIKLMQINNLLGNKIV